jgi:SAM-dependent methyltransferase
VVNDPADRSNSSVTDGYRPGVVARDAHGLGYQRVDAEANVAFLVATMEATSRWDSIRKLRAWERGHLELREGERLLDVGCGLGDAAVALSSDLGPTGQVVGIDASAAMLAVARDRAGSAPCPVRFTVGDAMALNEPSDAFDAVRSERTLQWLADPGVAVAEMARALRPGGRLALIDTDWSTLEIDVGDAEVAGVVREAVRTEGNRPSHVGRRLGALVRAAGLDVVAETSAPHVWTQWDPDAEPAPDGCFSMRSLADDLVESGDLDRAGADRFVATIDDAARRGRFSMSLTMFAVVARA